MPQPGETKTMAEADMKRLDELLAIPITRGRTKMTATRVVGAHSRRATDPLLGTSNHFPEVSTHHRRTLSAPAEIPHYVAIKTVGRIENFELDLTEQVREQARIESQRRLKAIMKKKTISAPTRNARGGQMIGSQQRTTTKIHHLSSPHNRSQSRSSIGTIEEFEPDLPTQARAVRSRTTSRKQHYQQQLRLSFASK